MQPYKPTYDELALRITELEQEINKLRSRNNVLALRESTLQALLNAPTESAILVDLDGTILAINEVAATRIGKSVDELIGLGIFEYLPHDVALSRINRADKIFSTGKPLRFQDERAGRHYDNNVYPIFNEAGEIKALAIFAKDITDAKQVEEALLLERNKLRAALSKIKKLSGMLPICASCKKIRDDRGYWNQIESYIRKHSEAQFSHGICPECATKLYPEIFLEDRL